MSFMSLNVVYLNFFVTIQPLLKFLPQRHRDAKFYKIIRENLRGSELIKIFACFATLQFNIKFYAE